MHINHVICNLHKYVILMDTSIILFMESWCDVRHAVRLKVIASVQFQLAALFVIFHTLCTYIMCAYIIIFFAFPGPH